MLKKIKKFLKKRENKLFLLILLVGIFFRVYKNKEFFMYSHDQDLIGWFIRDVVERRHLRLIGQETSVHGIFIGPLFYYLLIPFYLLFSWDPLGGRLLVTILGAFSIYSFYVVFKEMFGKKTGLVASALYATSPLIVFTDREVVPTMPVMLISIWFLYAAHLFVKGKVNKAIIVSGLLIGLIWHINIGLALIIPSLFISSFLADKREKFSKSSLWGGIAFIGLLSPLILFELRHGFQQVAGLTKAFTAPISDFGGGADKMSRLILVLARTITKIFTGNSYFFPEETSLFLLLTILLVIGFKRLIDKKLFIIFILWILTFFVFFSTTSLVISEYYLNGLVVIWLAIVAVSLAKLLESQKYKTLGLVIILWLVGTSIVRFFQTRVNESGYIQRRAIVSEIKKDAQGNDYPCVSVSYITKPGFDLGYRYLFWLEGMHVNRPDSLSPVYTVVFPLRDDIKVHKTFGVIGLIYPDYSLYTKESVVLSCSGANSNVTDPLFGFVD